MLRASLCVVCVVAGTAGSSNMAWSDVPDMRVGVSFAAGDVLIGDESMSSVGAEPEVGYRIGPVLALARLGVMRVGLGPAQSPDRITGSMYQYGLSARVPVHTLRIAPRGGFELWAEGGFARRSVYWDDVGVLRRDAITAAVGFDGIGPLGDGNKPHTITFGLALRAGWAAPTADDDAYDPSIEMLIRVGWQR